MTIISEGIRHEYVIASDEVCLKVAKRCGKVLGDDAHELAITSLYRFIHSLLLLPLVEGVAFLASKAGQSPASLTVEAIMPLRTGADTSSTLRAITDANAALKRDLRRLIASGLGFVDTSDTSIEELRPSLRARWSADSEKELLAFGTFERS